MLRGVLRVLWVGVCDVWLLMCCSEGSCVCGCLAAGSSYELSYVCLTEKQSLSEIAFLKRGGVITSFSSYRNWQEYLVYILEAA